jgi:uncharacterized membrane protein YphA (DoxX/SURF4 family)
MTSMPQGASAAPGPGALPGVAGEPSAPTASAAAGANAGWRPWAGRLGAALLGLVLLVATAAKALDPEAFAQGLAAQGLTLGLPPLVAALVALALEGGLGLALLLGARRPLVLGAAAALVLFFLVLNARSWWVAAHGGAVEESCGCFGNLVQRTPAEAFWQDLALLVPPLLLAFVGRPRRRPAPVWRDARVLAAAAGAAAVALFAWRAPVLPLDDLATRLRPGVQISELCTGGEDAICLADLVPELQSGRWQVVLVDVERSPESWADGLNRVAESGSEPLLVLTASPTDRVTAFTWEWGPSYRLREAPAALLRPLHRRLPRSFVSEDGRVVATSPGLPAAGGTARASRLAEQGDRPR